MKEQAYIMIATMVVLGCLAISAEAQCESMQSSAYIPFQFIVGNSTLPAGQYTVDCLNTESNLLRIRSADGKTSLAILTIPASRRPQDGWKLVFRRYGSRYFFAQAWAGGSSSGLEFPESAAERKLERDLAHMKPKRETVALSERQ